MLFSEFCTHHHIIKLLFMIPNAMKCHAGTVYRQVRCDVRGVTMRCKGATYHVPRATSDVRRVTYHVRCKRCGTTCHVQRAMRRATYHVRLTVRRGGVATRSIQVRRQQS
jgi:hypothetical protein